MHQNLTLHLNSRNTMIFVYCITCVRQKILDMQLQSYKAKPRFTHPKLSRQLSITERKMRYFICKQTFGTRVAVTNNKNAKIIILDDVQWRRCNNDMYLMSSCHFLFIARGGQIVILCSKRVPCFVFAPNACLKRAHQCISKRFGIYIHLSGESIIIKFSILELSEQN